MNKLNPTEPAYVLGRVGEESRDRWFRKVADICSAYDDLHDGYDPEFLSRLKTAAGQMLTLVRADLCVQLQSYDHGDLKDKYRAQISIAQGLLCRLDGVPEYEPTFVDEAADKDLTEILRISIGCVRGKG